MPKDPGVAFDMVAPARNADAECDAAGIVGLRSTHGSEIAGRGTAFLPVLSSRRKFHICFFDKLEYPSLLVIITHARQ